MFLLTPTLAVLLIGVGVLAVIIEFLAPGKIIPSVIGAVCITIGARSLWIQPPEDRKGWTVALVTFVPLGVVIGKLLYIAWMARQNKRSTL